jgi:hypothetical protein
LAAGASTTAVGASTTGACAGADAGVATVFFATVFLEGEAVELIVLDAGRVFILLLRTDFIIKPAGSVNFYFFLCLSKASLDSTFIISTILSISLVTCIFFSSFQIDL